MKLKTLWVFMAAFFILGAAFLFVLLRQNPTGEPDTVVYNDIARSLGETWESLNSGNLPGLKYHLDYAVLDLDGNLHAETKTDLDTSISAAIRHRDTILDVVSRGSVVGNVIIMNSTARDLEQQRLTLVIAGLFLLLIPLLFCAGFAFYLHRRVVEPFKQLDSFAQRVAAGNLDIPLEMDKQNIFGPFTESFDLMRSELANARSNENLANQSKKELVASLSHDIKTPVASIQAITELMLLRETDADKLKQLDTISEKTKQITGLVNNLFNASLQELQKLKVIPREEDSVILSQLLRGADYSGRAEIPDAPPCLLNIDRLRLSQVFDNIFNNSYKYAGTAMEVRYDFSGEYLAVKIVDFGPGVPAEILPLISNKFYRGENAQGISGSGLGLYLARYFVEQMGGGFHYENHIENGIRCGFAVRVELPLAGRGGV